MGGGVIAGTLVILRSRWQVARNTFWRGGIGRKLRVLVLVAVAGVLSYGLYQLSGLLVRGLQLLAREQPAAIARLGDLDRVLGAVPSVAFTMATVPVLLGSVSFALATLYLASDLDLLLVT